jgi:DNA polymerase I
MTPDVWTLDFETQPIGPRPGHYPPEPVGLAIRTPEGESHYMAWGHPTGNNCSRENAARVLRAIWAEDRPIVFHNAKFDLAICYEIFGLPVLPWERVHDTMFLAFLLDPYARSIGLKQLAVDWLGMPPDEQDAVRDYVLAHKADMPRFDFMNKPDGKPTNPTPSNAGAWIAYVPAEIVGPYAIGDVARTWGLFQVMYPSVVQSGMGDAYDVERRLLPHVMENERTGLRVDVERLQRDVAEYQHWFEMVEGWLRWRLNAPGLNFDADQDVADYLESTGIVTEFAKTATGQRSVSKKTMHPEVFTDQEVAQALGYRNRLKTCLSMFMEPWLKQALTWNGRISCEWNMVSNPDGGTRTGRPSTRNHNLLNISKEFEGKDGYTHPTHLPGLPELPLVRRYIIADEGHILNGRDFDGQEMRVFGHFEQGELLAQYEADPKLDVHGFVGGKITDMTGQTLGRGKVKILNFQALYGGGVPAAKDAMRCTYAEAQKFKAFHDSALPGRRVLANELSAIVREGGAVRTYGGRLYVRPPLKKQKNGRIGDSDYILINYLVQGSSADVTKRALLRLLEHPDFASRWLLNVYDELVISSPVEIADEQSRLLGWAMSGVPLRVALLTDAEQGPNWGEMTERKDL